MTTYGVQNPARAGATFLTPERRLGWAEWGPESGEPVLFFSGAAMGRELGFGGEVLDRLGVRLISVERPGIGASDPSPARTLDSWADDVAALLRLRALPTPRIVAFSQGAPFALACAAQGLAHAVALVSGQDDFGDPEVRAKLNSEIAALVRAVREDPDAIERTFAETANVDMMWKLVFDGSSELDRRIYGAPEFAPAYRRCLEAGFCQGAAGYARDFVLAVGPWPFDVTALKVPVDVWYGGQDASPVHSPDFGERLCRRLQRAQRFFMPQAGGSLLWTCSEEILRTLLLHPPQ